MTIPSFDRMLCASRLALQATGRDDDFRADRSMRLARRDSDDRLEGKVRGRARLPSLDAKLSKARHRTEASRRSSPIRANVGFESGSSFDHRQRAIMKVHYFNHGNGGAAALRSHARYVARDAATRDDLRAEPERSGGSEAVGDARSHSDYLTRDKANAGLLFYDAENDRVDGAACVEAWARSDKRHFRLILSAEAGDRLHDLPSYAREVMSRAEAALGTKLQWVAVDHWDTAHPHTHLIIRGRRANGQDLVIPRDILKHGLRHIARDVATEWLGPRTLADDRLALAREICRHAPTRLDRLLAAQLPESGVIRMARIAAPNGDRSMTRALKDRARELQRMGLAREVRRNVLSFAPDWRDRLRAMELHLDIRKRLVQQRVLQQQPALQPAPKLRGRGGPER